MLNFKKWENHNQKTQFLEMEQKVDCFFETNDPKTIQQLIVEFFEFKDIEVVATLMASKNCHPNYEERIRMIAKLAAEIMKRRDTV
uniref:Uncharacterized protein n=1 Tax=Marseillevirus LCMAC102 TaxID=2506603 RepID=A0A481YTX7_9VIRU|nr:MAG: hypothetical protein LCMAC102_04550 [Marseillevirus LCMAC102]